MKVRKWNSAIILAPVRSLNSGVTHSSVILCISSSVIPIILLRTEGARVLMDVNCNTSCNSRDETISGKMK